MVIFVPALRYPNSELAPIMYLLSAAFMAESRHMGVNILAAIFLLLSGLLGALLAVLVNVIADGQDTPLLLMSVLIAVPACISLRFGSHPRAPQLSTVTMIFRVLMVSEMRGTARKDLPVTILYTLLSAAVGTSVSILFSWLFDRQYGCLVARALCGEILRLVGDEFAAINAKLLDNSEDSTSTCANTHVDTSTTEVSILTAVSSPTSETKISAATQPRAANMAMAPPAIVDIERSDGRIRDLWPSLRMAVL